MVGFERIGNSPIISPWLTPLEAARYCRLSLSLFNQKRKQIPIKVGGTQRRPRFHRDELDFWMRIGFKKETGSEKGLDILEKPRKALKEDAYKPSFIR